MVSRLCMHGACTGTDQNKGRIPRLYGYRRSLDLLKRPALDVPSAWALICEYLWRLQVKLERPHAMLWTKAKGCFNPRAKAKYSYEGKIAGCRAQSKVEGQKDHTAECVFYHIVVHKFLSRRCWEAENDDSRTRSYAAKRISKLGINTRSSFFDHKTDFKL